MEQNKLIAGRLKWARENLDVPVSAMADACGIGEEEYLRLETGNEDFSFTFLFKCAKLLGMDISELVSGSDPKLDFYNLTRAGGGMPIKREKGFEYRHVAPLLKNRMSEPFIVTAKYEEDAQNKPIPLATHKGQEFNLILTGQLKVQLGKHTYVMNPGDTIYYDSAHPHGMIAVGGTDCTFLAVVYKAADSDEETYAHMTAHEKVKGAVPAQSYENCIYKNYVDETFDEHGRLTDIKLHCNDNFNFAYDVVDALAAKVPDKKCIQ